MGKNNVIFYTLAASVVFITVIALGVWFIANQQDNDDNISSSKKFHGEKLKNKTSTRKKIEDRKKRLHKKIKRKNNYKTIETGVVEIDTISQQIKGMTLPDDKIELIDKLDEMDSPALPKFVKSMLNDSDPNIRLAALELLDDKKQGDIADCVDKALDDPDEDVREYAATLLYGVKQKENEKNLLVKVMNDSSENVRDTGFDVLSEKSQDVQEFIFEETIHSPYKDIKENTADAILDIPSHSSVLILFEGLKDTDDDFVESVNSKLDYLFGKEFKSYEEAIKWWNNNKNNYDNELFDK